MDPSCRLVTYTEVHFAPPAFQGEAPYLLGVAELKNGLRVFAPITSRVNRKELRPGLKLSLRAARRPGEGVYYELDEPTASGAPTESSDLAAAVKTPRRVGKKVSV